MFCRMWCDADFDAVTFNWIGEGGESFQDFGMNKQCLGFEGLLQWQKENVVDGMLYKSMRPPQNVLPCE